MVDHSHSHDRGRVDYDTALVFFSTVCWLTGRVGFEPTRRVNVRRFSRPVHSTALPPAPTSTSPYSVATTPENSHVARLGATSDRGGGPTGPVRSTASL